MKLLRGALGTRISIEWHGQVREDEHLTPNLESRDVAADCSPRSHTHLRGFSQLPQPRAADRFRKRFSLLAGARFRHGFDRSAAATVFAINIATVIGPTPPGTGVIKPAFLLALS